MSIYSSPEGKQALEEAYDSAVNRLEVRIAKRKVDTRHGTTHVLTAGPDSGQPIIILHGGNSTNPLTLSWFIELAEEYRLIAPDIIGQPGYSAETRADLRGAGYGEWIVDLLYVFGVQTVPMIGASYGSGIVLRTSALAPNRAGYSGCSC